MRNARVGDAPSAIKGHVATDPEPVASGRVVRRRPVDREVITARAGQLVGNRNEGHTTVGQPGKLRTRGERERHVKISGAAEERRLILSV